ncbi:hypothetical protein ACH5RR_036821 [Cinchona calisaya]|uniref:Uncharacterized protein n=1 Tax=Cinchona calisaya TaxID=153742 RepID=A0ABD2Y7G2_9GENT
MNREAINIDLEDDSDLDSVELDHFNTPIGPNAQESTQVNRKDGDGADVQMKSEQHIRKRRKTSEAWQYFDELKVESDGIQRSPNISSLSSSIHGENSSHSFGAEHGKDVLDILMENSTAEDAKDAAVDFDLGIPGQLNLHPEYF